MSNATTNTEPAALEDLLERRLPSAIDRHDTALKSAGVTSDDMKNAKDAFASIGLALEISAKSGSPTTSLRDRLLASRQRTGKFGIFTDRIARLFDLSIDEAAALMTKIEQNDAWNPFLVEGVDMIPVTAGPKCEGAITTLVRIAPGTRFPDHTHRGDETMIVLDGGFVESSNVGAGMPLEEVWRGDEVFRPDGTDHALVGLPGVPCIAAVVIFGHGDFH